jgi:hypothetical protein
VGGGWAFVSEVITPLPGMLVYGGGCLLGVLVADFIIDKCLHGDDFLGLALASPHLLFVVQVLDLELFVVYEIVESAKLTV